LRGLDRGPGDSQLPILADAPARRDDAMAVPINHRHGQNVLFADGHVRFCTISTVGVDGDDIFTNQMGHVGAGIRRTDTSLGGPNEKP
jgi:prepilin-type processing-associated H-X9-DG protein